MFTSIPGRVELYTPLYGVNTVLSAQKSITIREVRCSVSKRILILVRDVTIQHNPLRSQVLNAAQKKVISEVEL